MRHDYGDPARGESYEEANFHSALRGMKHEVVQFDFMERKRVVGTRAMRRELVQLASEGGPFDVCFFVLFGPEINAQTILSVKAGAGAPTVNWFADDHWRFDGFTDRIGPAFDWCVTTDADSLPRYRSIGIGNVILSQWACNTHLYRRLDAHRHPRGVTFVGRAHSDRPDVVRRLRSAGIDVDCWGRGWDNGRLSTEEMIGVFSGSAINLNLANSAKHPLWRVVAGRVLGYGGSFGKRPQQIKGRTFEIPGCGGFQLTEYVPHIERYFELEREISTYSSTDELIAKIRYWLAHPDLRTAVAEAGYQRVLREHTYDRRFSEIFATMGVGGS